MTDKPEGPPHATIPWPDLTFVAHRCGYAAVFVYGILRSFDRPNSSSECFPSVRAIAERAQLSERRVAKHLAELKKAGAIEAHANKPRGRRGRPGNVYQFPALDPNDLIEGDRITRENNVTEGDRVSGGITCRSAVELPDGQRSNNLTAGVSSCTLREQEESIKTPPTPPAPAEPLPLPELLADFNAVVVLFQNLTNGKRHDVHTVLNTATAEPLRRCLRLLDTEIKAGMAVSSLAGLIRHRLPGYEKAWREEQRRDRDGYDFRAAKVRSLRTKFGQAVLDKAEAAGPFADDVHHHQFHEALETWLREQGMDPAEVEAQETARRVEMVAERRKRRERSASATDPTPDPTERQAARA